MMIYNELTELHGSGPLYTQTLTLGGYDLLQLREGLEHPNTCILKLFLGNFLLSLALFAAIPKSLGLAIVLVVSEIT